MTAYCVESDLLLGDLQISSTITIQDWIERAAEEIDTKLVGLYEIPLTGLTALSTNLLKRLNASIATGRILLALDGSTDLNAYGRRLLDDALVELAAIASGTTRLPDATRSSSAIASIGPKVSNQDAYSATAAFEDYTMVPRTAGSIYESNPRWQPHE